MAKRKPRVSIRRKMAFSYVMLVLLVALISVGFMLVFLDGYVVSRERVSLVSYKRRRYMDDQTGRRNALSQSFRPGRR